MIGKKIIRLDSVDSTNNYLKEILKSGNPEEGLLVIAEEQIAGRGQAANIWLSNKGENLTFSFLLYPNYIKPINQFLISKFVCLALADLLEGHLKNIKIKWPNDIYVKEKKIAGILIENILMGKSISSSIVGIGLNINQFEFPSGINATSMLLEKRQKFNTEFILQSLIDNLNNYLSMIKSNKIEEIGKAYISKLYRYKEWHYFNSNGKTFKAFIEGVDEYGRLILKNKEKKSLVYGFKEVLYI
ncbi:MAG: biotin--[acetyl-CoA-carboxylase] ligase [Bacteroidales bacterium]